MKTFEKLTLWEYQELYKIHNTKAETDEQILDRAIETLSILEGKSRQEIEDRPYQELLKKSKDVSILFSVAPNLGKPSPYLRIGGQLYKVCLNPRKLTTGQFTDVQGFLKRGRVENLHKVIASIVRPVSGFFRKEGKYDAENHEVIAEEILDVNIMKILAISGFFLRLWNSSIKALVPYLEKQIRTTTSLSETDLQTIMDGYTQLTRLENHMGSE